MSCVPYTNRSAEDVALVTPATVTVTSEKPDEFAGAVTRIEVELLEITVAGVPPKLTVAPLAKFIPAMSTTVPPVVGPDAGMMPVTVGTAVDAKLTEQETVTTPVV
jgi:hypothetical protein